MSPNPIARRIPLFFTDVVDLNNSMPPARPRNNVTIPPMTKLKAASAPGVIIGKKTPETNAKIAIK